MSTNYLKPFSDWLSISYPTTKSPHLEIISFFNQYAVFEYFELGGGKELYKSSSGTIHMVSKDNFVNLSLSGSLLNLARKEGEMVSLQMLLSSGPYNITRLDIAYDAPMPGHLVLSNIRALYPTGYAKISSRERQLQYVTNQLETGKETGTCYFQTKKYKGTLKLRVYDKAYEQLQEFNRSIPPTTRYELTIGRGASLKDFSNPENAFWHFIPSGLLRKPVNMYTCKWVAKERIDYDDYLDSKTTDYERLKFLIHNSPALLQLVRSASTTTGGRVLLEREISYMFANAEGMERSGNQKDAETCDVLESS